MLDMTPDGQFRNPPKVPIGTRIAAIAIIVAVAAGALAIAAIALWIAFLLIPVVLAAGLIGYIAFRFQMGRRRSFRGSGNVFHVDISRR